MNIEIKIPMFRQNTDEQTKNWLRAIHVQLAFALANHRLGDSDQAEKALDRAEELTSMGFDITPY